MTMLIAAAATLASSGVWVNLGSIGEISNALTPLLGEVWDAWFSA
jgi:hypothetical protein